MLLPDLQWQTVGRNRESCLSRSVPSLIVPNHLPGRCSLGDPSLRIDPDDRSGGAPLHWLGSQGASVIVNQGKMVFHFNLARRIGGAPPATCAGDLAIVQDLVTLGQGGTGNPKSVGGHLQRKQIFRAGLDTIPAGRASHFIHDGQIVRVHLDGVKITSSLTVPEPDATPKTCLPTAGDDGRGGAAAEPLVVGLMSGHVVATGARQPCDTALLLAHIHTEKARDPMVFGIRTDGALARHRRPGYKRFSERVAAGVTAGAAVGVR